MFETELYELELQHLLRKPIVIESCDGPRVTVNGKSILLMCSNDYLGLSGHPALREAAQTAMNRFGFGAGASRLISGTMSVHQELEQKIARFKHAEAAILFNTGYGANTGIIPVIAGKNDVILSDSLNHASIIDGCRLSKAHVAVYRHRDMDHLQSLLKEHEKLSRKLIVTDGVFSMDGDIAPLPAIVALAEKYQAIVMVDDAHATGVLGKSGRGTAEHFGLSKDAHIQMGTLGKALGSFGAYAAGSNDIIDFLVNRSRSYIFSTALPPAVCAASISAIDLLENDQGRKASLWKNREHFVSGLRTMRIPIGQSETPIIPLMIGDAEKTLKVARRLFDLGIFATAVRPPTVPDGASRIRMTVTAIHTDEDVERALLALKQCSNEGLLS